jgi:hypothetical protein
LVFTASDLKRGMANGAAMTLTAIDGDTPTCPAVTGIM